MDYGLPVVCVQIDRTRPSGSMEYYLSPLQWLDASGGIKPRLREVVTAVRNHFETAVTSAKEPKGERPTTPDDVDDGARTPGLLKESPAYLLPDSELLKKSVPVAPGRTTEHDTASVVLMVLARSGVEARLVGMVVGPRVTRYELELAPGTKVAKVSALEDDLAYTLSISEIRVLAPIPGKSAMGVEVPNERPDFVTLGDIYREFPRSAGPLMVWLGKDMAGRPVSTDVTKLPHLLIAGATGSGKSACVNCILSSILLRSTPEQVGMILIDPKKVELSQYDRIPHLLVPVVTNMKDAAAVLHNVAKEMEDRYELLELEHSRSLADMNKARARRGERPVPFILVVIDELADLMMVSPLEVEECIVRLAQRAPEVGIHLVVATQRPSADVITGMIKANIPSRMAFAVFSQTDSRVILDVNGAETLLGSGDMLFRPLGASDTERVQGAYITEEEMARLVSHWRHQAEPEFREDLLRRAPDPKEADSDDLLADAAQLVIETGSASVPVLQRRLRVGYARAGRLIDMLERWGIVGPYERSRPREILVGPDEAKEVLAKLRTRPAMEAQEKKPRDG
jgi:S-DNA-T family DNA segregation ATPase FtsK/SpoIIIE